MATIFIMLNVLKFENNIPVIIVGGLLVFLDVCCAAYDGFSAECIFTTLWHIDGLA